MMQRDPWIIRNLIAIAYVGWLVITLGGTAASVLLGL